MMNNELMFYKPMQISLLKNEKKLLSLSIIRYISGSKYSKVQNVKFARIFKTEYVIYPWS